MNFLICVVLKNSQALFFSKITDIKYLYGKQNYLFTRKL